MENIALKTPMDVSSEASSYLHVPPVMTIREFLPAWLLTLLYFFFHSIAIVLLLHTA
jgi:hypothetical protein